jgi:hypothetical protein
MNLTLSPHSLHFAFPNIIIHLVLISLIVNFYVVYQLKAYFANANIMTKN